MRTSSDRPFAVQHDAGNAQRALLIGNQIICTSFFVCLGIKSEINQQRSHESHQESYTRVPGKSNLKKHFFYFLSTITLD